MRVMIAAGGSGGHIFPAISLGRSLKKLGSDIEVMYIGSDKSLDRRMFEKEGVRFATLSSNKLPYKISAGIVLVFFRLALDLLRSLKIVFSYKPDVTVGFGGYVSFPMVLISSLARIPTIVHEQNAVPGRANKLLFRFADKIAVSFEETKKATGRESGKCVFIGNPIRPEISGCDRSCGIKRFGFDKDRFTILVIGGSQGATFLNRTFVDSIAAMDPGKRSSMQVIHITGVKDYEWALKAYEALGIDFRVHSFIDRIDEAYAAADLVVTRAGASAIFELAFLKKPMILIPYPLAMSHQLDNALAVSTSGAGILMEERDLSAAALGELMLGLMGDKDRLKGLANAAARFAVPKASDNLAAEVAALKRRQNAR